MLLESIQGNAVQLAIKIRGDVFRLTRVVESIFHKIKITPC